jgi:hypothetical protein
MDDGRLLRAALLSMALIASTAMPVAASKAATNDSSACGSGQPSVVVGTDNPAVDVPAVQAAVDGNDTVQLTGTFDFGVGGRVVLSRDVQICGEADEAGMPLTTVRRGEWDFYTPYPSLVEPLPAGPKVGIAHIHFVESRGTAIHLAHSSGATIQGNVIDQMRARQVSPLVGERAAIVVGPALLGGAPNTRFFPNLISGDIVVSDNQIDVSGSESTQFTRATGMFVSMYVGADVRIERNHVAGNTRTGLAILDGTFDSSHRGSVVIAENVIQSAVRVGFNLNLGPRAPIGIVTGFNNQRVFGSDPNLEMIPAVIENNTIELGDPVEDDPTVSCGNTAPSTPPIGIINIWNGALLTHNTITVHGHPCATTDRLSTSGGILATTSRQVLTHNKISGDGCNAFRIGGTVDGQERFGNVAIGNNLTHFTAFSGGFNRCVDVWLEPASHDNTVVGNAGTVIDDGVNNKVTGFGPVKGGVGDDVSDAVNYANDLRYDFG